MGSVLASAILAKADTTLLDTAKTRWPDAEKLPYLNDGPRLIVLYKPDANVVFDIYRLIAGTKQRIPDGSNIYQNIAGDTLKEGLNLLAHILLRGGGHTRSWLLGEKKEKVFSLRGWLVPRLLWW